MNEDKSRKVFAKNLNRIMAEHEKTPANLNADLGIPFSTLSNWTNGLKMPRMGKVELLARYFNCEKSDFLDEHSDEYYENKETACMAQRIKDNGKLKALFDVQSDMTPDDLDAIYTMALALKKKEGSSNE